MRIILTVNFSPWSSYSGGGQRSTHELATALAARGNEVTVVYTRPPWERVSLPQGLPYGVAWAAFVAVHARSGSPLRSLNAFTVAARVERLVRAADEPVVVHAQGEEGAALPRLRPRLRFGMVVTPRYPRYPAAMLATRRSVLTRARRLLVPPRYLVLGPALRGADRWCPTSESSARAVRRAYGLSEARCRVVPNGVAPAFLAVERAPHAAQGPVVFFGRLVHEKGARVLLQALSALGDAAPPAVIVGRGPEEPVLRGLARDLGLGERVQFSGWQPPAGLARLLAGARMAVLPSNAESFGNAMVEAMAAGVPLVSTTAGSIPEVVAADRTGILVAPGDRGAVAEAMRRLESDRPMAERMGQAGRRHVLERYSWDATAKAFEQVYAEAWASR